MFWWNNNIIHFLFHKLGGKYDILTFLQKVNIDWNLDWYLNKNDSKKDVFHVHDIFYQQIIFES